MQIQWFGQSFFKIQTKNNGQEIIVATDPYDQSCGLKPPAFSADILTISHDHDDHNNIGAIKGEPFLINTPGEYETKGVFIYGLPAWHDGKNGAERGNTIIYKISAEDISVVHLGDLGQELTNEQIENLGNVDVLLIPVGGQVTIDAKKAAEIVSQLEPKIVIPMHYRLDGLKFKFDAVENFIKEVGLAPEKIDKLKIVKKDLPMEETKLIILSR